MNLLFGRSFQIAIKQTVKAVPVSLCTGFMKNLTPARKGKAMLCTRIPFETVVNVAGCKVRIEAVHHIFRRIMIDFSAGKVDFASNFMRVQVG